MSIRHTGRSYDYDGFEKGGNGSDGMTCLQIAQRNSSRPVLTDAPNDNEAKFSLGSFALILYMLHYTQLSMKRPYIMMSLPIACLIATISTTPTNAKEKSVTDHRPVFENPSSVAPPVGAYSHIARVSAGSELIVLAGQVGIMPDGTLPESIEEQYAQALRNVVALLASQGATPNDIVKINYFLAKPMDRAKMRETRTKIIGEARPPSTLVYVSALAAPQYLVEIEAWAVKPSAQ